MSFHFFAFYHSRIIDQNQATFVFQNSTVEPTWFEIKLNHQLVLKPKSSKQQAARRDRARFLPFRALLVRVFFELVLVLTAAVFPSCVETN